jgi:hypothetical protein
MDQWDREVNIDSARHFLVARSVGVKMAGAGMAQSSMSPPLPA